MGLILGYYYIRNEVMDILSNAVPNLDKAKFEFDTRYNTFIIHTIIHNEPHEYKFTYECMERLCRDLHYDIKETGSDCDKNKYMDYFVKFPIKYY